jgi:cytochrome P450
MHPKIQYKLRDEIRANVPDKPGQEFDLAAVLESLPLLNGVCNEAIRLYPTVPVTIRDTIRETSINGVTVPRGTQIHIVPWAINRLPSLWGPDAAKFIPLRWVDAETGKPNNTGGTASNYNILTFLHGPRSCIGKDFAKAELRCMVAAFVRAFEMEYADPSVEAIPHGVITTKPKHGMSLRLKVVYTWQTTDIAPPADT